MKLHGKEFSISARTIPSRFFDFLSSNIRVFKKSTINKENRSYFLNGFISREQAKNAVILKDFLIFRSGNN